MHFASKKAELIGIMLGDGNIYVDPATGQYQVRITGHENEADYLKEHVAVLLSECFRVKSRTYHHSTRKGITLYVYSKRLVSDLLKLGLKAGNKKINRVSIPNWIWKDNACMIACIRGLIDTDGCVYKKYSNPKILQIEYYSAIPSLLNDLRKALKKLGFKVSKITAGKRETPKCGIYAKDEVIRYCGVIGFNNPKYKLMTQHI